MINKNNQEMLKAKFKKQKWKALFSYDQSSASKYKFTRIYGFPNYELEILKDMKSIISKITINKLRVNLSIYPLNSWLTTNGENI